MEKLLSKENLVASDLIPLLELENADELFLLADKVRREYCGDTVHIRAILEFSNYCRCNCAYCGLFAGNKELKRYRMTPEEIVKVAIETDKAGYKTIVLQSGEDLYYTKEMLGDIVKEIKEKTSLKITLSVGERPCDHYKYWKECGADRFLIKHETADETLYNKYHSSSFENRLECQKNLFDLGYELGSGFMVGLPGQDTKTLAEDILHLKELKVRMAGIGPYICHEKTALKGNPDGDAFMTLKSLAVARIVLKDVNLPSTTALNIKGGLNDALNCGANVIMQKVTPENLRDLYDIYPGRESKAVDFKTQLDDLKDKLSQIGRIGE